MRGSMSLCCRACLFGIWRLPHQHHVHSLLKGIKVRDAASKRAAKEAVKERRQAASMEVDDE